MLGIYNTHCASLVASLEKKQHPFRCLDLPPELRLRTYAYVFEYDIVGHTDILQAGQRVPEVAMKMVSRLLFIESQPEYKESLLAVFFGGEYEFHCDSVILQ
jgi:hypothetical protein